MKPITRRIPPIRPTAARLRGRLLVVSLALALVTMGAGVAFPEDPDTAAAGDTTVDIVEGVQLANGRREVLPAATQPFRVGESLRFSVQYGFFKAGTAWLEVPEERDWNGNPAYVLVARAQSNGFFDKIYKVRNRIESVWDQRGRFSWRYLEDRHEGKYTANDTIVFDPEIREARYKNGQTYPIPANAQDALSAFYFTRYHALPIGGSFSFEYHASRKSAPLEVKVIGRQTVKTPAGKFKCVVVEPMLKAGGIFKNKGRLVIWLTDDERRMPVLMRSKVLIGSISVVLQEVKGAG